MLPLPLHSAFFPKSWLFSSLSLFSPCPQISSCHFNPNSKSDNKSCHFSNIFIFAFHYNSCFCLSSTCHPPPPELLKCPPNRRILNPKFNWVQSEKVTWKLQEYMALEHQNYLAHLWISSNIRHITEILCLVGSERHSVFRSEMLTTPLSNRLMVGKYIHQGLCTSESFSLSQFSSVAQSCLTLCDPMDCSKPGFPVLRCLPEFSQTRVHWVSDAIQPPRLLSAPSPPVHSPRGWEIQDQGACMVTFWWRSSFWFRASSYVLTWKGGQEISLEPLLWRHSPIHENFTLLPKPSPP